MLKTNNMTLKTCMKDIQKLHFNSYSWYPEFWKKVKRIIQDYGDGRVKQSKRYSSYTP